MVDFDPQTEFTFIYAPVEGSLSDLQRRFRVSPSGRQIRDEDGTATADADFQVGKQMFIPKPAETVPYAKADWQNVAAAAGGESIADLLKRTQTGADWKGRVYRPESNDTPAYLWFDWRNWSLRQKLLGALPDTADRANVDADPGSAKLAGGQLLTIPLAPVKNFEAPVAPGTAGGTAPKSMIDVSQTDLATLQEALEKIEITLDNIMRNRERAIAIQKQCDQWMEQINAIHADAVFSDSTWTSMDPAAGDGKRPQFIAAMDALIQKGGPLLLRSAVSKMEPGVTKQFGDDVALLFTQITNKETLRCLAEIVPLQGDLPIVYETQHPGAETTLTIDHVCELAATAAYWIAEGGTREQANQLLEAAMSAMKAGAPPSADCTSIIDFAVSIEFYPETANPACQGDGPVACCGAVSQVYIALKLHQALADSDGSLADPTLSKVGAAQGTVLAQYGWKSYAADFQKATKDEFKLYKAFDKAYTAKDKAKVPGQVAALKAATEAAGAAPLNAAAAVEGMPEDDRWEAIFDAKNEFGEEKMGKAYAAYAALGSPGGTFKSVFSGVDGWFGGVLAVGSALAKCTGDVLAFKDDSKGDLNSFKGGVDIVKDTLTGLNKLKLVTSVETQEFAVMLGRVSLVVGVAVELCEVVVAVQAKDVVGGCAHGALAAAGVCFLVGGTAVAGAPVYVVVGAVLLVGGTVVLVARGDLFKSDVGIGMKALLPDGKPSGSFESKCRDALGLGAEIDAVRAAFQNATFDLRLIGPDLVQRQMPGPKM